MKSKCIQVVVLSCFLMACSGKEISIAGTWKIKEVKLKCSNELLQAEFGDMYSNVPGEITLEFLKDSTFKKTTVRENNNYSSDANMSGTYVDLDSMIILNDIYPDTLRIAERTDTKLVFIFRDRVTRPVEPAGKCDLYHYYEKQSQ